MTRKAKMTREIGSTFKDGEMLIQVVSIGDDYGCSGCVYERALCEKHKQIRGECVDDRRADGENIIFKLIQEDKNETK